MISSLNASNVGSSYAGKSSEVKNSGKAGVNISKQGDTSKVDVIKDSLKSGEYKINLQTLSEKIAQELL
jgi:anti-sigma28 factor (negative regulator of flagellin synthesis)